MEYRRIVVGASHEQFGLRSGSRAFPTPVENAQDNLSETLSGGISSFSFTSSLQPTAYSFDSHLPECRVLRLQYKIRNVTCLMFAVSVSS